MLNVIFCIIFYNLYNYMIMNARLKQNCPSWRYGQDQDMSWGTILWCLNNSGISEDPLLICNKVVGDLVTKEPHQLFPTSKDVPVLSSSLLYFIPSSLLKLCSWFLPFSLFYIFHLFLPCLPSFSPLFNSSLHSLIQLSLSAGHLLSSPSFLPHLNHSGRRSSSLSMCCSVINALRSISLYLIPSSSHGP